MRAFHGCISAVAAQAAARLIEQDETSSACVRISLHRDDCLRGIAGTAGAMEDLRPGFGWSMRQNGAIYMITGLHAFQCPATNARSPPPNRGFPVEVERLLKFIKGVMNTCLTKPPNGKCHEFQIQNNSVYVR